MLLIYRPGLQLRAWVCKTCACPDGKLRAAFCNENAKNRHVKETGHQLALIDGLVKKNTELLPDFVALQCPVVQHLSGEIGATPIYTVHGREPQNIANRAGIMLAQAHINKQAAVHTTPKATAAVPAKPTPALAAPARLPAHPTNMQPPLARSGRAAAVAAAKAIVNALELESDDIDVYSADNDKDDDKADIDDDTDGQGRVGHHWRRVVLSQTGQTQEDYSEMATADTVTAPAAAPPPTAAAPNTPLAGAPVLQKLVRATDAALLNAYYMELQGVHA